MVGGCTETRRSIADDSRRPPRFGVGASEPNGDANGEGDFAEPAASCVGGGESGPAPAASSVGAFGPAFCGAPAPPGASQPFAVETNDDRSGPSPPAAAAPAAPASAP